MIRFFALAFVFRGAGAQFHDLATPADGSVVYFTTRRRRAGTDEPFQGRVYAVDAGGLRLFAERAKETTFDGRICLSSHWSRSGAGGSLAGALARRWSRRRQGRADEGDALGRAGTSREQIVA